VRAQVQVVPVRVDELEGEHREILRRGAQTDSTAKLEKRKTKLAPRYRWRVAARNPAVWDSSSAVGKKTGDEGVSPRRRYRDRVGSR